MIVVYQTFKGIGHCHFLEQGCGALSLIEPSECLWMVPNLVNPYAEPV